jgi:hypothetical protein
MRSEKEIKEKKDELLKVAIDKHNKLEHGLGCDDRTEEMDGKIYALEYVLGERRDI